MKILSVEAINFMSFKRLSYSFPDSGLIFVGGEVQDSAMSSSNGAGKSALFEALCWGLYGKTLRGAAVGDVVNWAEGRNCFVQVMFCDDTGTSLYTIQRYRNDKERGNQVILFQNEDDVTGAGSQVTQEAIEAMVGMSWLVFSAAVVFGEKAQRFTEARDSEKKQIFDEILLMSRYQEAQKEVRADMKEVHVDMIRQESSINSAESALSIALGDYDEAEKSLEALTKDRDGAKIHLDNITKELEVLRIQLAGETVQNTAANLALVGLEKDNKDLLEAVVDAEKQKSTYVIQASRPAIQKRVEVNNINGNIEKLQTKLKALRTLKGQNACPTCGQKILAESIEDVAKHYNDEITDLVGDKNAAEAEIIKLAKVEAEGRSKWDKDLNEIISLKSSVDKDIRAKKTFLAASDGKIRQLNDKIGMLDREKVEQESRFEERESFLTETIERVGKRIEDDEKILTDSRAALAKSQDHILYLAFWEGGFGNQGIKSLLLDEILPELNSRVNFYATALCGEDMRVVFDTESTLKGGGVRDKFDVQIFRGEGKVDYATLSAGEKRRVDVAILLALQSLIFERNANDCNLVVLDEVFDSLDRVGVERVVNLLAEEAKDKAIFVISHLNEFRDYFEQEVIIRKHGGVSEIVGAEA